LIKKLNRFKIIELQTDLPDVPSNQEIDPVENSLIHFIDQLPSHQKEVIYLRYYKDKSFHEIAQILGIKYQVARNFSYRGIKFLRNKILVLRTYKIAKSV
jgi:RNA polymerase sigma factor (sigma-70 family)